MKFFRIKKCDKGFTLIEVLAAISIFIFIAFMSSDFIIQGFRSLMFNEEQEEAVYYARKAMDTLDKEIREIVGSEQGDYALDTINPQEFIFYADINGDSRAEKVRYFLDSSLLKKGMTLSASSSPFYAGSETISEIARYMNNQTEPLFRYYDANGAETAVINNIRMVGISLKVNVTPETAPNDYYVESYVHIRNLKDNL